jgi:hypothetical protein
MVGCHCSDRVNSNYARARNEYMVQAQPARTRDVRCVEVFDLAEVFCDGVG